MGLERMDADKLEAVRPRVVPIGGGRIPGPASSEVVTEGEGRGLGARAAATSAARAPETSGASSAATASGVNPAAWPTRSIERRSRLRPAMA